jgi:hypothetical protein
MRVLDVGLAVGKACSWANRIIGPGLLGGRLATPKRFRHEDAA